MCIMSDYIDDIELMTDEQLFDECVKVGTHVMSGVDVVSDDYFKMLYLMSESLERDDFEIYDRASKLCRERVNH